MDALLLTGEGLTAEGVVAVARERRAVTVSGEATERMRTASQLAQRLAANGELVYGLTTGVGALRGVRQSAEDAGQFNRLTIQAHRTSHGPLLPGEVGRAALGHRPNPPRRRRGTVRPEVAAAFADALNGGIEPRLPAIGSVGQSDLPAMAELVHLLQQDGLQLAQGESLSLLNGNSLSTGLGAMVVADSARLLDAYD